jgi:hypothetical protein
MKKFREFDEDISSLKAAKKSLTLYVPPPASGRA